MKIAFREGLSPLLINLFVIFEIFQLIDLHIRYQGISQSLHDFLVDSMIVKVEKTNNTSSQEVKFFAKISSLEEKYFARIYSRENIIISIIISAALAVFMQMQMATEPFLSITSLTKVLSKEPDIIKATVSENKRTKHLSIDVWAYDRNLGDESEFNRLKKVILSSYPNILRQHDEVDVLLS
ncbi:MAG: hypothetical protein K0R08_1188 [Solimicrobium sp.]|nr:hypothetical protein [Solimicrobium sp.]